MPYFTSRPTSPSRSLDTGGTRTWSVDVSSQGVRLDLEGAAGRRAVDAGEAAVERDAVQAERPAHRCRQRGEVVPLVAAANRAADLEAPGLVGAAVEAQRLERDDHLHRPAAGEAAGADVPHRVPVAVGLTLVDDRVVGERAERAGVEHEAAAPVVEGVEADADVVVLPQRGAVAPVLVGDPLLGRRRVVDPRADVDVLVVEHQPHVGALAGRLPGGRHRLDEIAERRVLGVDGLVERAVDVERGRQPDGPHRGLAALVAGDGRGGDRGRRTVDDAARAGSVGRRRGEARGRVERRIAFWARAPVEPTPSIATATSALLSRNMKLSSLANATRPARHQLSRRLVDRGLGDSGTRDREERLVHAMTCPAVTLQGVR